MAELKSAPAADFDRDYIGAQVEGHKKLLSALDEQLIPSARDSELKTMLHDTRATVESHLKEAEKIQSSLAATPGKD